MIRHHTGGDRCHTDSSCPRWHTTDAPERDPENQWVWPVGTRWTTPYGDRISPRVHPSRAPSYHPYEEEYNSMAFEKQAGADAPPRAVALNEARDLITGDRNNQYGPPTQDFDRTAKLLNALGYARVDADSEIHDILASDVALIIAQVKVSRLMHTRDKRDSWVDLAGYAACGYECAEEEAKGI